jgi:hypothetical protein
LEKSRLLYDKAMLIHPGQRDAPASLKLPEYNNGMQH